MAVIGYCGEGYCFANEVILCSVEFGVALHNLTAFGCGDGVFNVCISEFFCTDGGNAVICAKLEGTKSDSCIIKGVIGCAANCIICFGCNGDNRNVVTTCNCDISVDKADVIGKTCGRSCISAVNEAGTNLHSVHIEVVEEGFDSACIFKRSNTHFESANRK